MLNENFGADFIFILIRFNAFLIPIKIDYHSDHNYSPDNLKEQNVLYGCDKFI